MLPDYYSYTAVFTHDNDAWYVEFPDLERCATNADSLDEAIIQAGYILKDYMAILERDNMPIPAPTPHEQIHTPNNGEKQRIVVPMHNARIRWRRRNVKRTVSLPAWVVQSADNEGLNLSAFLQDALTKHINNKLASKL